MSEPAVPTADARLRRSAHLQGLARLGRFDLGLDVIPSPVESAPARDRAPRRQPELSRAVELILARQLASQLHVPVLIVDERGDTLFYNEPAEAIFGRPLDQIGALPFEERTALLAPRRENGESLPLEQLPAMLAMRQQRPAHAEFASHGLDGVLRWVEATAIPIASSGGQVVGALIVMWPGHMAHPQ